jgi:hypothetical protein
MDKKNELQQFEKNEVELITKKITEILKQTKNQTHQQIDKIIELELKDKPIFKDIEDWQADYSRERIKDEVFSHIQKGQEKNKSLAWFNFYVYFRLPFGIVISFLLLFTGGIASLFSLVDIIIFGTLFWGLKKRELWAWKMNFFVLIFETIALPLGRVSDGTEFIIFAVILTAVVWLLPNWIYFKKRKYLFLYSEN